MIFYADDIPLFKKKTLLWASSFNAVCYLDSNNFHGSYAKFDALIAVGIKDELIAATGKAFDQLAAFREKNKGYLFGFFGYDLKNEIENLHSQNQDHLGFPDLHFFAPQYLILINNNQITITADAPLHVFEQINTWVIELENEETSIKLHARFTKAAYIAAVNSIKAHITRGDIYVSNFCQEFFAEEADIDPLSVFMKLNEASPNPFSGFYKWHNHYILCASPERFLAKRGQKLISQPIKGTARRGDTAEQDEAFKHQLKTHQKELQENVMIVDLVRNDLTLSAKPGTVITEELFGVYSFKHLHQMISTVVCYLRDDVSAIQAIKNTFPMGSMTGAPKISAMQLMEHYEQSKRGVYSGAMGYFCDDGDFDFNVVIRSILYNAQSRYLSFQVGSAITYDADAAKEYEECLIKAQAILEVLGQPLSFPPF